MLVSSSCFLLRSSSFQNIFTNLKLGSIDSIHPGKVLHSLSFRIGITIFCRILLSRPSPKRCQRLYGPYIKVRVNYNMIKAWWLSPLIPQPTAVQHVEGAKRANVELGVRQIGWTARSNVIGRLTRIRAKIVSWNRWSKNVKTVWYRIFLTNIKVLFHATNPLTTHSNHAIFWMWCYWLFPARLIFIICENFSTSNNSI